MLLCVFAFVSSGLGETMKTFSDGNWRDEMETTSTDAMNSSQMPYSSNAPSSISYSSLQPTQKTVSAMPQHYNFDKKPNEIEGILTPTEYVRTIVKRYPVYINEKHSSASMPESGSEVWPPEVFAHHNGQHILEQGLCLNSNIKSVCQ